MNIITHKFRVIVALLSLLFLSACSSKPEHSVTVLAGSEVKDLQAVFEDLERKTGIKLAIEYSGTLDGAEKLASGVDYDFAWFSHNKYMALLPNVQKRIHAQEKIMISPVVLGVRQSLAQKWGWINNPNLTWRDIAEKAKTGELRYAMANPSSSNSGFSALMGLAAVFSSSQDAILKGELPNNAKLHAFFKGQVVTAGSSGWLADNWIAEQDQLEGIINYESVLMSLNASGKLREPLTLIYPKEGIVTADYPLTLLNPEKRAEFDQIVTFFKSKAVQHYIMADTWRRPVNHEVPLKSDFYTGLLIELPFPAKEETVNQLLTLYLDENSRPSHTVYVLDVSGSMQGEPLRYLQQALTNLTGLDRSISGRFARFRQREKVTFIPFNHAVAPPETVSIQDTERQSKDMRAVRRYVDNLHVSGGTAAYDALLRAYQTVSQFKQDDPERFYSIVLMTDGLSNNGLTLEEFQQNWRRLPENAHNVRVFPILFGASNDEEMKRLAEMTHGRVFNGRTEELNQVFKKIRGYQ